MPQLHSSVQYICSRKTLGSFNMWRQTCFLPRAPSNLGAPQQNNSLSFFKFPTFFQTQHGMAGSLPTRIARSVNCSCVEGFGKAEEFLFEKSNSKRCSVSTRSKTSIKHEISSQKLDNSFRYQSEQCMERATPKGRVQPVVKITSDGRILRKRKERVT